MTRTALRGAAGCVMAWLSVVAFQGCGAGSESSDKYVASDASSPGSGGAAGGQAGAAGNAAAAGGVVGGAAGSGEGGASGNGGSSGQSGAAGDGGAAASGGAPAGGSGGNAGTSGNAGSGGTNNDGGTDGSAPGCPAGTEQIYLLDETGDLYKFCPPTLEITLVGPIACTGSYGTYSMAIDRYATAWVLYQDGKLYKVNINSLVCTATSFQPGQAGFDTFGLAFSTDTPGGNTEKLFVSRSVNPGATLGVIDTTTLTLTVIGAYDSIDGRAEMTGTGDARLFGAFEGTPYVIAEIDKTNAHILSKAPQNAISYEPSSSNFAFAHWGGDFWLFVGPGTKTDIFQYKPSDNSTTLVKTLTQVIVGAGVSTRAPVTVPD
jgi:hypothetical protein